MELDLQGRRVLVTGGSKGIGKAIAVTFAEEGCDLHLVARNESDLEATWDAIADRHQIPVVAHVADLGEPDERERIAEVVGDIDILVNNAGAIPGGGIDDIVGEDWRSAWELKVFGYIHLARIYYARMRAQSRGVIVNVVGIAGQIPMLGYIAGSAANAALI